MLKEKLTNRRLQAIATKNKIFNTATKLIRKKGFENISVNDICKAADISVGLYYHYYKSKHDILFEIYDRGDNHFKEIKKQLRSPDSIGKIKEYLQAYINFVAADGFDMVKHLYISENKVFIAKGRAMQTILVNLIEEGQTQKQISEKMLPSEAVNFIFVILRGVVFDWCLHDGQYDLTENAEKYIQYICWYLSLEDL